MQHRDISYYILEQTTIIAGPLQVFIGCYQVQVFSKLYDKKYKMVKPVNHLKKQQ